MDAVQAPIIPIVGQLIRATPGTISLGQGIVHYGPPAEALDVYFIQPLTEGYLGDLQHELASEGFAHTIYLMLSSGGITDVQTAARFPVRLVESGPAAGADSMAGGSACAFCATGTGNR